MTGRPDAVHGRVEEHSKVFRDLLLGFVKVHVLYYASKEAVYGVGLTVALEKHGYRLSPGTLYPLLHNLEAGQLLTREERVIEGKVRKYYQTTPLGRMVLDDARAKVVDLVEEVVEAPPRRSGSRAATKTRSA